MAFSEAWEFRPIYATLLMEVLRDLRLALPRLITLRDPDALDTQWPWFFLGYPLVIFPIDGLDTRIFPENYHLDHLHREKN